MLKRSEQIACSARSSRLDAVARERRVMSALPYVRKPPPWRGLLPGPIGKAASALLQPSKSELSAHFGAGRPY